MAARPPDRETGGSEQKGSMRGAEEVVNNSECSLKEYFRRFSKV